MTGLGNAILAIAEILGFQALSSGVEEINKLNTSKNDEFYNEAKRLIENIASKNNLHYNEVINKLLSKQSDATLMVMHAEPMIRAAGKKLLSTIDKERNNLEKENQKVQEKINEFNSVTDQTYSDGQGVFRRIGKKIKDKRSEVKDQINNYLNNITEDFNNNV